MPGKWFAVAVWCVGLLGGGVDAAAVVRVSVAYYDTEHASPSIPNPWLGSPDTMFIGNPDAAGIFDTGAILLTNLGPGDASIGPGLKVDGFANGASFQIWDARIGGGIILPEGHNLIFAQLGSGTFDTSDQPIINNPSQRTNDHPVVHIAIDATAYRLVDATQVLNTGGFDPGEAFQISESRPWTQLATVPEPSSLAYMVTSACAIVMMGRRK